MTGPRDTPTDANNGIARQPVTDTEADTDTDTNIDTDTDTNIDTDTVLTLILLLTLTLLDHAGSCLRAS